MQFNDQITVRVSLLQAELFLFVLSQLCACSCTYVCVLSIICMLISCVVLVSCRGLIDVILLLDLSWSFVLMLIDNDNLQ